MRAGFISQSIGSDDKGDFVIEERAATYAGQQKDLYSTRIIKYFWLTDQRVHFIESSFFFFCHYSFVVLICAGDVHSAIRTGEKRPSESEQICKDSEMSTTAVPLRVISSSIYPFVPSGLSQRFCSNGN